MKKERRPWTKSGILRSVAAGTGRQPYVALGIIESLIDEIRKQVWRHGSVCWPGLGTFRLRSRKARTVTTPDGSSTHRIRARQVVVFRASSNWRTR